VPSLMGSIFIASFASRRMRPLLALCVTIMLTAFCVLVFNVALGLPLQLLGPWLVRT
jgi:hypothetical protein